MKTVKLYETDAYIKSFEAVVLSCKECDGGYKTVLSRTAFFPEAGGQPCDKGHIGEAEVTGVTIENGEIYHYTTLPLNKGETLKCEIDFRRRFNFMQNHTAEHIVSGLVYKKYGFDNIGFHLNENEVTFDFNGFFTACMIIGVYFAVSFAANIADSSAMAISNAAFMPGGGNYISLTQ